MKPWRVGLGLAAALVAASCAGADNRPSRGDHGPRHRPDGEGRPARTQLFISPSGQPFRAPPGAPYPVAAWFAQADANHDGRISRDEFRADAEAFFRLVDTDGDGAIGMREVSAYEDNIVPEITGLGSPGFGGGGRRGSSGRGGGDAFGGPQGAAWYSLLNEPQPIRSADADFSMSVSQAEWRAATERRFGVLDRNANGVLTLDELPRTPTQSSPRGTRDAASDGAVHRGARRHDRRLSPSPGVQGELSE